MKAVFAFLIAAALVGAVLPDSKPDEKPAKVVQTHEDTSSRRAVTDSERTARRIAREFHANFGPTSGYETHWHRFVARFDHDLDPLDGSLAVHLKRPGSFYRAAEVQAVARGVLGVGFPLGLCKVDVLGADNDRVIEAESQGRGC